MLPVDRLNSWCRWAVSVYPKRWAMSARLRSDHSTYRLAAEIAQARLIFIPDTPSAARRRSAVLGCKPSMRYKSATFARGNAAKKSQLSRTRAGAFRMRAISPTVNPLCGLGCVARRALRDRALSKNGPRASNRLRCSFDTTWVGFRLRPSHCIGSITSTWMLYSDSWNRWLADWRRKDSKARMGRLQDMDQTFTVHGSRAVEVGCIGPSADRGSGHGRRHVRAGRCSMAQSPRLAIDRRRYAAGGSFELMVQVGRVGVPETLGDVGQAQVGPQDVLAGR